MGVGTVQRRDRENFQERCGRVFERFVLYNVSESSFR